MNAIGKELGLNVTRAIALLVLVSSTGYGWGSQTQRPNQTGSAQPGGGAAQPSGRTVSAVLVSPEEDYRIGLNDVLDIKVEGAPELTQTYRVTAAGTFLMPWVGRVPAAKKTTEELAQYISDKLRGDYLKDPKVSVTVTEYNSRAFMVLGEVRSPGLYRVEGKPSMLELITLAGGLTDMHGANAFIIRRIKTPESGLPPAPAGQVKMAPAEGDESNDYELKTANVNGLLKGDFKNNVLLEPGDIVNIPALDVFYVAGEVNAPGKFSLKEGTSLRQAISLAQGTNYKAALKDAVIFRETTSGKREELHINVGAIMSGKKEDVPILANDLIMIPNSRTKSIGGALLKAFGITTVSRVPIP